MTLLCPYCFDNKGLRRRLVEIRPRFDEGPCDYHPTRKGIPVEAVTEVVDEVFRANFTFGGADYFDGDPEEPVYYGSQRGDDLQTVVNGLTQPVDDDIAQALVAQLIQDDFYRPQKGEEPFYDEDANYARITEDDHGHGALWERFCYTVSHEQRFMNPQVAELLGEIFKYIHLQRDVSRNYPVYVMAPANERHIFRARAMSEAEREKVQRDPAGELGPPPIELGKPNRMNPSGITAFYGALELETCLSELRPLVGAEVVSAEFRLVREIVVLDTTRFAAPPKELNLFSKDHVRRLAQWRFMQRFMAEIAKPILPSDEHLHYVPTQVVAEFLNKVHEVRLRKARHTIDAIIYRSAQRPEGANIVLLGDAARVEGVAKPWSSMIFPSHGLGAWKREEPKPATLAIVPDTLRSMTVASAHFALEGEFRLHQLPPLPPPKNHLQDDLIDS